MERLNTFLIVVLLMLNFFFILSRDSHEPESREQVNQIEWVEFQNQMSAQLFVVESEIRSLHKTLSDFPNTDMAKVQIFERRERAVVEQETSGNDVKSFEYLEEVNDYLTTIISSGVINHANAFELRQELSKLGPEAFEAALSRINVAINNQELQLEPGVVL